jgi:nucleotide-binding universal stress UspA family protein
MSPIRSVLVHLDGCPRAAVRLGIAHELCRGHEAALTALFAVAPRIPELPPGQAHHAATVPAFDRIDPEHRRVARAMFDRAMASGAVAGTWRELAGEPPVAAFIERALHADLVVLGQRDPVEAAGFDVPADFVESVIMASGKPALVVPYVGEARATPDVVLVAWKPTRESARALAASLPILQRARRIHVVASAQDDARSALARTSIERLLQLHGIHEVRQHPGLGELERDAGNGLLSLAADVGADLLVMGCYGHSRALEFVLGGASRTILQSMTLPVLMAH